MASKKYEIVYCDVLLQETRFFSVRLIPLSFSSQLVNTVCVCACVLSLNGCSAKDGGDGYRHWQAEKEYTDC